MKKTEIIQKLKELDVKFNSRDSKEELLELLKSKTDSNIFIGPAVATAVIVEKEEFGVDYSDIKNLGNKYELLDCSKFRNLDDAIKANYILKNKKEV